MGTRPIRSGGPPVGLRSRDLGTRSQRRTAIPNRAFELGSHEPAGRTAASSTTRCAHVPRSREARSLGASRGGPLPITAPRPPARAVRAGAASLPPGLPIARHTRGCGGLARRYSHICLCSRIPASSPVNGLHRTWQFLHGPSASSSPLTNTPAPAPAQPSHSRSGTRVVWGACPCVWLVSSGWSAASRITLAAARLCESDTRVRSSWTRRGRTRTPAARDRDAVHRHFYVVQSQPVLHYLRTVVHIFRCVLTLRICIVAAVMSDPSSCTPSCTTLTCARIMSLPNPVIPKSDAPNQHKITKCFFVVAMLRNRKCMGSLERK